MNWYLEVLKKYAVFSRRARRREYWLFALCNLLVAIALGIVDGITGTFIPESGIGLLGGLYALAILIPSLAVTFRRLHDTARSGWWILIAFVPLIGGIVLLIFMLLDSDPADNRFGPNPRQTVTA